MGEKLTLEFFCFFKVVHKIGGKNFISGVPERRASLSFTGCILLPPRTRLGRRRRRILKINPRINT